MKVAPVYRALQQHEAVNQALVHTGQHYDAAMSDVFFQQLEIPEPVTNLSVGSGTHAQQTAEIMRRFEPVVVEQRPDWVVVYGDVNSTVAAALVCAKLGIRVAHVEAGLRCFDRSMPEEINRLVTDQLSDLLLTSSEDGNRNLAKEGIPPEKIHLAGNVMIDTLIRLLPQAGCRLPAGVPQKYALVTLHRPSNVDHYGSLHDLYESLSWVSEQVPVLFPVHPRTRNRLSEMHIDKSRLQLLDPLPYLEFLALQAKATLVITDSGGIQEETTYLGVPCLTMRDNTERPVTITLGRNELIGRDTTRLRNAVERVLLGKWKRGGVPPLWDGHTGERIAGILTGFPPQQADAVESPAIAVAVGESKSQ